MTRTIGGTPYAPLLAPPRDYARNPESPGLTPANHHHRHHHHHHHPDHEKEEEEEDHEGDHGDHDDHDDDDDHHHHHHHLLTHRSALGER
jgi:hypothetical protein